MRFNPKADIDTSRVDDSGSGGGSSRLPIPTSMGGGKAGLILMLLGFLVRFLLSRRRSAAATR